MCIHHLKDFFLRYLVVVKRITYFIEFVIRLKVFTKSALHKAATRQG